MPTDPLAPPRPELLALLDAVKDDPDDDTPRLVLADWLDEQDNRLDAERAKFIRRDVAASRAPHPPRVADQVRRDELELFRRWLGPLTAFASSWSYARGLPQVTISGPKFLSPEFRPLLASEAFAFVDLVRLEDAGGPRLEAMVALPEFRHVPGLSVHPFHSPGAASAAKILESANLSGLRHIAFRSVKPGAVGVEALAANPALARLRRLSLAHNKLVDKAVRALATGPHLRRLEKLDLSDNAIGDAGAEALAASATLADLRELDLRANPRLTPPAKQRLRARVRRPCEVRFDPLLAPPAGRGCCILTASPRRRRIPAMSDPIDRRTFAATFAASVVLGGEAVGADPAPPPKEPQPTEAAFERDYPAPGFKPGWKKPQLNRLLVQDFVIYAHSDPEMVKKLLDKEPALVNAFMDWGGGDWESGLGGASHMGRRDIVELFLERGARMDIFCAAMMGQLDAVKAFLTLQPKLIDAKGPHGFGLHFHGQLAGKDADAMVAYLQSVKKVELRPNPFVKKPDDKQEPPKKSE